MKTHFRPEKNRSGQALVEFALVAPILLLIVVGLIQFGHAWNAYQAIVDMGREAARVTVVANGITEDSVRRLINSRLALARLDSSQETVNFSPAFTVSSDLPLTVEISYPYRMGWLAPFMSWTTGQASITLKTTTQMRQE
jgi:Flp pilus assembly protein TadG